MPDVCSQTCFYQPMCSITLNSVNAGQQYIGSDPHLHSVQVANALQQLPHEQLGLQKGWPRDSGHSMKCVRCRDGMAVKGSAMM